MLNMHRPGHICLITPAYALSFLYVHIDIVLSTGFLYLPSHMHMRIYVCTYTQVCMHAHMHTVHTLFYLPGYMHVCMIHLHTCVGIYVRTWTHNIIYVRSQNLVICCG